MRRILNWFVLVLLTILCLYDGLILYGLENVQLGPKPEGLAYGVAALLSKVVGLLVLRLKSRIGLIMMVVSGVLGWIFNIAFLRMDDQHHPIGTALQYSLPSAVYVVLTVGYAVMNWRLLQKQH